MSLLAADVELRAMSYADPAIQPLIDRLQAEEYVVRYGGRDETPLTSDQFGRPEGVFLVAWRAGVPVAMGGWRRHVGSRSGRVPWEYAVEIKRMYVTPEARGIGLARRLLAELERLAGADGAQALVLETGAAQPEAIALYRSAGYVDIPGFGHYCGSDESVHLGKELPR